MDLNAKADALTRLVVAHDGDGVAALFAPDARIKQNVGAEMDLSTFLSWLRGFWASGLTSAYENVRRVECADALIEQHDARVKRPSDGQEIVGDVCVILRFDEKGAITRLDEYVDSATFASLMG